jgi:hypothetical protein
MQTDHCLEPPDRAAPGVNPGLVLVRDGDAPAHDAYEPAWSALTERRAGARQKER